MKPSNFIKYATDCLEVTNISSNYITSKELFNTYIIWCELNKISNYTVDTNGGVTPWSTKFKKSNIGTNGKTPDKARMAMYSGIIWSEHAIEMKVNKNLLL